MIGVWICYIRCCWLCASLVLYCYYEKFSCLLQFCKNCLFTTLICLSANEKSDKRSTKHIIWYVCICPFNNAVYWSMWIHFNRFMYVLMHFSSDVSHNLFRLRWFDSVDLKLSARCCSDGKTGRPNCVGNGFSISFCSIVDSFSTHFQEIFNDSFVLLLLLTAFEILRLVRSEKSDFSNRNALFRSVNALINENCIVRNSFWRWFNQLML